MKIKNMLILISTIMLFSGCASLNKTVNPVSIENTLQKENLDYLIKKPIKNISIKIIANKTKLNDVIKEFNKKNKLHQVVINELKNNYTLKYNYTLKNISDFIDYVNITLNKKLNLIRYNSSFFKLTENLKDTKMFKDDFLIDISKLDFIDIPLKLNGEVSYADIIDIIDKDFHIPIIIKNGSIGKDILNPTITTTSSDTKTSSVSSPTITANESSNGTMDIFQILRNKTLTNYQGTIKKVLQRIAIDEKLFIDYKKGIIILSPETTKVFDLKIPSLDYKTANLFKDMTAVELNPYEDLKNELKTILGNNSSLNMNESTGQILIKGNYDELREAQIILKKFYDTYNKTIAMDVYIYEVDLNKNNKFGVSFNTNTMEKILGMGNTVTSSLNLSLGSLSSNPKVPSFGVVKNYIVPSGSDAKFNKFFLKFLNNFGNTKILTKPKLETINNIPVSMKITTSQDYVSKIDNTTSNNTNANISNTTTATNVTKDTIETGFTLGLYPMAEDNGRIKIILKPVISQLLGITPYTYGDETNKKTIQLITKSQKDFSQIVNIRNNQVALISGYIYETNKSLKDTLPFMDSTKDLVLDPLLSTKEHNIQRKEMIIAIKARIIN